MYAYIQIHIFYYCFAQDLTSVQNLQKKHALLEADVGSHQDRIEAIRVAGNQFVERGHFDSDNIRTKQVKYDSLGTKKIIIFKIIGMLI